MGNMLKRLGRDKHRIKEEYCRENEKCEARRGSVIIIRKVKNKTDGNENRCDTKKMKKR